MHPTRDTPAKLRGVSEKQRSRPLVNSVKPYSINIIDWKKLRH